MRRLTTLVCALAVLFTLACISAPQQATFSKPAATATKKIVLDVRTPEEFSGDHVAGAINIPVDDLESQMEKKLPSKNTPVIVYCASGRRAKTAQRILEAKGYRVENLGTLAKAKASLGQ